MCVECLIETVGKGPLDMFIPEASPSHHGDGDDSDESEHLIIILASWWLRCDLSCLSQVQCCWTILEYTLHLVIRIEWWGPRRKVSGLSPVTSTTRLHFPRCDFTVKTRGVVRASTIGVLVRQLRQGYRILCKKTSGHCKFMQYCHYFHSDTVCLT